MTKNKGDSDSSVNSASIHKIDHARLRRAKSKHFNLCSSWSAMAASPLGSTVRPVSMSLTEDGASPTDSPISAKVIPLPRRSEMRDAQDGVMGPSLRCAVEASQRAAVTDVRNNASMPRPPDLPSFKSLGKRIAYWRDKKGLTRRELGNKVGLKYSTIASLENGDSKTTDVLHKFAVALGLNLRYLETDEGDPFAGAPPPEDTWPFPGIDRKAIEKLGRVHRKYVEIAIKDALRDIDEDRKNSRDTG